MQYTCGLESIKKWYICARYSHTREQSNGEGSGTQCMLQEFLYGCWRQNVDQMSASEILFLLHRLPLAALSGKVQFLEINQVLKGQ